MAVEAHHLHLFPPQQQQQQHVVMIPNNNRGIASAMENYLQAGVYGTGAGAGNMGFYAAPPPAQLPANLQMMMPFCNPAGAVVSLDASDSGLTFNDLSVASSSQLPTKRPRPSPPQQQQQAAPSPTTTYSFLGEDITSTVQQQQLEVDHLVAHHAEKVRREMQERRRQFSRRVAAAVEGWVLRRIRDKEEEIEKVGRLNTVLEERMRSLCVENQIWRDLAQTNEAAATALRCNLEQVLLAARQQLHPAGDDESCCDNDEVVAGDEAAGGCGSGGRIRFLCRLCGAEEASVLLLPCRHLCLCAGCGPSVVACPVCRCDKNGSVNVNMS